MLVAGELEQLPGPGLVLMVAIDAKGKAADACSEQAESDRKMDHLSFHGIPCLDSRKKATDGATPAAFPSLYLRFNCLSRSEFTLSQNSDLLLSPPSWCAGLAGCFGAAATLGAGLPASI